MPGSQPIWKNVVGVLPPGKGFARLPTGQAAGRRIFASIRASKGMDMKNDRNGLTIFEELPAVDPAVESLLGQGQRRQVEAHLPRTERSRKKKERERAEKRKPNRINLDLPVD